MLATCFEDHAGSRLRVARLGEGPPLLLLHGYPDNLQIFAELAPRLAGRFSVIAPDWPGMGRSEAWPGGTTPWHQAQRLLALLDAWGLPQTSLLAMDMGGQPALVLAALHPDRVDRLVVMNSLVVPDAPTSCEIRLLRRFRWNEALIRLLPGAVCWRAERSSLPAGVRLPPELRAEFREAFGQPAVRRFVSRLCGGYQGSLPRLPALYPQVRCPSLVLWGERDRHFPPAHGRGLAAALPVAQLGLLPEGEHWMAWHAAEAVADRVLAWAG
jgi:pimeloyl-ACP methyl ester carboxylesterase